MKNLFMLMICCLAMNAWAQPLVPAYSRVKILLHDTDIREVALLGLEVDHGYLAKGRFLINDFSSQEIQQLRQAGIPYEVEIEDVQSWYEQQLQAPATPRSTTMNDCFPPPAVTYQTPVNYQAGSMGGYFTYEEMLAHLDSMASKYPDLISPRQAIGTILTHEGRPIEWLRISDNPTQDEAEPEVLYTALHHAREPNSLSQMIFHMWYLLENYGSDPEVTYLVDNTQMFFIPCINPDGYVHNQTTNPNGGGLWRKNRWVDPNTNQVMGVDLNRNYDFLWAYDDFGSSPDPSNNTFRGTHGFSEPETRAVRDFCNDHNFQITLNYHTFGNLLIHPWGYNDSLTAEDATFKAFGKIMTQENNYLVGTGVETVGYVVNGDSDDWMYGETTSKPKIYSLTPEAGPRTYGFWPPAFEIDRINKENLRQNLSAAHLLLNYSEAEDQSEKIFTETNGELHLLIKKYGLAGDDVTLNVQALSPNVSVNYSPKTFSLNHLDEGTESIPFVITPAGTNTFEEFSFLVSLDQGGYTHVDTLRKSYFMGKREIAFLDTANALSQWTGTLFWGLSTTEFVTAPSSFTDSPNGLYSSNTNSSLTLVNPVTLVNAEAAFLRFEGKWAIEEDFDYAQVLVSTDGNSFTPLCGKYSEAGSFWQLQDEPLYDGTQANWVSEEIDLADYLGEEIYLRFQLVTDQFQNLDGMYVDDIRVLSYESFGVNNSPSSLHTWSTTVFPNPFEDQVFVEIDLPTSQEEITLDMWNSLGQVIYTQQFSRLEAGKHHLTINTLEIPEGMYSIRVHSPKGKSISKVLIKK